MLNTVRFGRGPRTLRALSASAVLSVSLGCAPTVVVDRPAGSGGGAEKASTTSSSSTGGATPSSCADREAAMNAAIDAARACDPNAAEPSCAPPHPLRDACGCTGSILTSSDSPTAIAAAQLAIDTFTQAGCEPVTCPSACAPAYGFCEPLPDGSGVCVVVMGD